MNNFDAIDKLTSFDDTEVLEALEVLKRTGTLDILPLIRDLQIHENPMVREAAQTTGMAIQERKVSHPPEPDNPAEDLAIEIPTTQELASQGIRSVSHGLPIDQEKTVSPASPHRRIVNPLRNPARGSGVKITDGETKTSRGSSYLDETPLPEIDDYSDPESSYVSPSEHEEPDDFTEATLPTPSRASSNDGLMTFDRSSLTSPASQVEDPKVQLARVDNFLEEIEGPADLPSLSKVMASERKIPSLEPEGFKASPGPEELYPETLDALSRQHSPAPRVPPAPKPLFSEKEKTTPTSEPRYEQEDRPEFITEPLRQPDRYHEPAASSFSGAEITPINPMASIVPEQAPPEIQGEVDRLLYAAINRGASDIHLFHNSPPLFRIHGDVFFQDMPPLGREVIRSFVRNSLGEMEYQRFVEEMEIDLAYQIEGVARFRVNIFNDISGIGMIFRHIPDKVPTMEDLKLPQVFKEMCCERKGLVLITGPTGSGKSTTLAAMIDWINRNRRAHILTIEDPVEFVHQPILSNITHRQVKKNTKTFNSALRSAMRQDPDVILIGEIRDMETIAIALNASETGHLVLGTLHSKNAARTVTRLVGSFPPREQDNIRNQLADGLRGIVAQTLVKTRDGNGRAAAFEVLVPNSAISNLIRKGNFSQIQDAMRSGRSLGMQTFVTAMYDLIKSRRIDVNEAVSHLISHEEREELKGLLKGN